MQFKQLKKNAQITDEIKTLTPTRALIIFIFIFASFSNIFKMVAILVINWNRSGYLQKSDRSLFQGNNEKCWFSI